MTNTELKKVIADKIIDYASSESNRVEITSGSDIRALNVADQILESVQGCVADQAFKAVGECKHCYGKGYASVLEPAHVASPDFIGDKPHTVQPSRLEYRFCQCERGQALKHLILTNAHFVLD